MNPPPDNRTHALYRFYDAAGALLYVGITFNPGQRWAAHRDDKPWWTQVARIELETHPDRASVLRAERDAIITEQPRHNVVHNRGTQEVPRLVPQLDRVAPFQVGDWVALGLDDGRCPVGEIAATDNEWLSLRLKSFWDGCITEHAIAVRWQNVQRAELAYPEDALVTVGDDLHPGAARRMRDEHLGDFQTAWERVHLAEAKDPVEAARAECRREQQDRKTAREARREGITL